ncbi:MFS transporter [Kocuria coralli]|uniref:MFS transporter n=1 Tax=Kocuria coralli TaxID=1461025 RepID=A0A5J5KZX3_9MICC|nr:MFS transporter [Kocuria coralli]KAA9394918.1 MFS transporter [Kocuria coralli]
MNQLKAAPPDHSSRIYLFTGVYAAVLYTVLLVAPVIAGPLIVKFGLSPAQVGLLFSLELGAFSLATVPAYLWLTRVPLTVSVTVCTIIIAIGHVVSGFVTDFGLLLVTRVVTSLAAGSITVVLLALGPRTRNPGRAFGIFVVAQLVMGAAILALFPLIYAGADVSAIYWTLAGLTAVCLAFVPALRGISLSVPTAGGHTRLDPAKRTRFFAGLAAILLFYVALSGIWSFMGQIAIGSGAEEGPVATVLAIATAAGIVSALVATVMGESPRRGLYLILGLAGMAVSVLLLLGSGALVVFVIAAVLFKFAWTFVLPYLLSGVSALGGGAQTMNTTNLMIGGGFAIGPIISGWLVQTSGGYSSMIWFAVVCLIASLGCAWVLSSGRLIEPAPEKTGPTAA